MRSGSSAGERPEVRVLLFATAREAAGGRSEVPWKPAPGTPATLAAMLNDLGRQHPELLRIARHAKIAVNGTYVDRPMGSVRLREHDEVAILPPYSGG